jgi:hypothetical protein
MATCVVTENKNMEYTYTDTVGAVCRKRRRGIIEVNDVGSSVVAEVEPQGRCGGAGLTLELVL